MKMILNIISGIVIGAMILFILIQMIGVMGNASELWESAEADCNNTDGGPITTSRMMGNAEIWFCCINRTLYMADCKTAMNITLLE